MRLALDVVISSVLIFFVIDAVISYRAEVGTIWQRLLAVGKSSASILWARFTVVLVALVNGIVWIAELVREPQVAAAVQAYLTPKTVAAIMIAVALISELARRRTLRSRRRETEAPTEQPR